MPARLEKFQNLPPTDHSGNSLAKKKSPVLDKNSFCEDIVSRHHLFLYLSYLFFALPLHFSESISAQE